MEHGWATHAEFLKLVDRMDIGLQVSLSETFNIVAADFVANGVPIIVSPEISWMPVQLQADPNSTDSIVKALRRVWGYSPVNVAALCNDHLHAANKAAGREWLEMLRRFR